MRMCATEDKTAVAVVASYCSVPRNPVRFKALGQNYRKVKPLLLRHLLCNCL